MKALHGLRSAPRLWGLTRDAVLAELVMCLDEREYGDNRVLILLSGLLCGLFF